MKRTIALLIGLAILLPASAPADAGRSLAPSRLRHEKRKPAAAVSDKADSGRAVDCASPTVLSHGVPVSDSTVGDLNNQATYGCFGAGYEWNGGEEVYTFTTSQVSDIRVALTEIDGGDVDLFILGACDALDCRSWGDETVVYPDAPAGTYHIVVDGWNTDEADYTITAWSAAEILLVDDDNSMGGYPDVHASYGDALSSLGRAYTWWPVDFLGPPTTEDMLDYKQVVWFTGADDTPGLVLSGSEESALAGYLDRGGMLILVSQEYLRDLSGGVDGFLDEGTFAFNYLQARSVVNDLAGQSGSMQGTNGDPIGDDGRLDTGTYTLTVSPAAPVANQATGAETLYGETVYRTSGGPATVLRFDNYLAADFFRVVFASFPIENVTSGSPNDLETLLDRTLTWMDQFYYPSVARGAAFDDSVTGDGNGLPTPGETVELEFIVENNDTTGHDAEAYLVVEDDCVTPDIATLDLGTVSGSGGQQSGKFRVDIDPACSIGHRVGFSVNLWINDTWYDTSGWGFFVGQADTMLVKDEELYPNTPGIGPYEQALQGAGVTYALHDNAIYPSPVYQDASLMSSLVMESYDHIIWMTGQDWALTLTPDDEAELGTLLDAGGKLLLASQDYLWDFFDGDDCNPACDLSPGDFAYDYLGAATAEQDVVSKSDSPLVGMTGEDLSRDLSFDLLDGLSVSNEADRIAAVSLADARPLFEYSGGATAGLIYEGQSAALGSTYRVISLWYPFENLAEAEWPNTRTETLRRALYWMDFGDTVTNTLGGPNTYYHPEDPALLTVVLGAAPIYASQLNWTAVTTNTNGDPIDIFYHLYSGFDPAGLERDPTEYQVNSTSDGRLPGPGQCIFYKVRAADLLRIESQDP